MDKNTSRKLRFTVVLVQILIAVETLVLAIPSIQRQYRTFRWTQVGGVVIYHGIGGVVLLLFVFLLVYSILKGDVADNLRYFTLAIFFGATMFLWSMIADSTALLKADPVTEAERLVKTQDSFNHDSIWFPLMSLFVLFLYLSIEATRTDQPPLRRVFLVSVGVTTPFFMGIASRIDGVNYVSGSNSVSSLSTILLFLGGLLFTTVLGVNTYYKQLRNVRNSELLNPALIQFASLLGLSEGLVIYSIDFALQIILGLPQRPLFVQFPLILFTFLPPLVILYWKNPSYISTLSTPIYELLVINDHGITQLSHQFAADMGDDKSLSDESFLKGGMISALTTIFKDITGSNAGVDRVILEDRYILLESIEVVDRTWIIALIILESNAMIRNALKRFKRMLEDEILEITMLSPDELDITAFEDLGEKVAEVFY